MSEILFRGKGTSGHSANKWVYGYYCKDFWSPGKGHGILPVDKECGGYVEVDPETVGQYSGMNDPDKVPIFDGSILQFGRILSGTLKAVRAVVRFENGAFIVEYRPGAWDYLNIIRDPFKVRACKVIGNIHDNPELLEKANT